jgi:hypothetical protein
VKSKKGKINYDNLLMILLARPSSISLCLGIGRQAVQKYSLWIDDSK